jgi:hypothetical protein
MGLDGLELALVAAGAVAGITGTWSPCGFSMIETIGPVGHPGGRATTLVACVTFTVGALLGGVVTFGCLALAGDLVHGADDRLAYALAAALAVAAAALEIRGTPIVPQVRRQLPEHWRRLMPMPVAAALYGVLLGLGFTTFVLTFGVFALAGMAFAIGELQLGVLVGLAFGAGRALPVAFVAPLADRPAGVAVTELMAGRPAILRGFRLGDGVALLVAAVALATTAPAGASQLVSKPAADPSVAGKTLVFQRPDRSGEVRGGGALPGHDPAVGDGRAAVLSGGAIVLLRGDDFTEVSRFPAPDADAVAVAANWVAWRTRRDGRDLMRARSIANPTQPGAIKELGGVGGGRQLGRPALDGNRLVYARASKKVNVIVKQMLGKRKRAKSVVLRSRDQGVSNPSIRGKHLLYVRHTKGADQLKIRKVSGGGKGRTLLSRRGGTLWSTALTEERAFVTHIHGTAPRQKVISAKR